MVFGLNNFSFLFSDRFLGIDTVDYSAATAAIKVNLGLANPQKTYGSGYDKLVSIENIQGSHFNDYLVGSKLGNVLIGGLGGDYLLGKAGADHFVLDDAVDSGLTLKTRDAIGDFKAGKGDKIDLSHIDADSQTVGQQAFYNVILSVFSNTDATGQLVFDAASHILYGSTDSDNAAEFSIALIGVNSLAETSLILV